MAAMRRKIFLIFASIAWGLVFIIFYVVYPDWLTKGLSTHIQFPLGTIISWSLLAVYAVILRSLVSNNPDKKSHSIARKILSVNIIFAISWGLISFFLSGNWAFAFQNSKQNFKIWIGITSLIFFLPLVIYFVLVIDRLFTRIIRR